MLVFMPVYVTEPVKLVCAQNNVRDNSYGFLGLLVVLLGNMS